MGGRGLHRDDDIDTAADQFHRKFRKARILALRRSDLDLDVPPLEITKVAKCLAKRPQGFWANGQKEADAPHSLALLRTYRERPSRRAAEKSDDIAPVHSITSSARAISLR
jgi:hypothetical protein